MERLRVRNPDTITRVTEYVPEIVEFVQGIIKNGYGYEFEGSVYFDTMAFDSSDRHDYAKIEPWSKGNRELLAEGEGLLIFSSVVQSVTAAIVGVRGALIRLGTTISRRFRALEGVQARRTFMAVTLGSRSPRLAY